jgi:hypothetical protein
MFVVYIPVLVHIVMLLLFHFRPMLHTAYCNAEISITGEFIVLYACALSVGVFIVLAARAETCRNGDHTYRLYISFQFLLRHTPFCV